MGGEKRAGGAYFSTLRRVQRSTRVPLWLNATQPPLMHRGFPDQGPSQPSSHSWIFFRLARYHERFTAPRLQEFAQSLSALQANRAGT